MALESREEGRKHDTKARRTDEKYKRKQSPGNQRSSRRTFCHYSLNVKLIFTDVLPHDSHQAGITFISTSGSVVCLSPEGPSQFTEFIAHLSTIFLSFSSFKMLRSSLVIDFKIIC